MPSPIYLDVRIPIITARIVLIITSVIAVISCVLLPFSFQSFNYLYNTLIHIPTIQLPLSSYILNYDFTDIPPFVIVGKTLTPLYANQPKNELDELFQGFEFDLNYDFSFKFNAFCQNDKNKYETVMYKVTIASGDLVDKLSPYGTRAYIKKRFHLWPLTNNIHQLPNPQVLLSSMNTFILNCQDDNEYKKGLAVTEFIPPAISWFVPPGISKLELNSKDTRLEIDLLKNIRLSDYITAENAQYFENGEFNIILEFNKPNVIIDPSRSQISIATSWKGLRYYLYQYRIISYIIGVLTFWIASSLVLMSTVSGLVIWRETAPLDDQGLNDSSYDAYRSNPVVLQKNKYGKFTGKDVLHDFDLEIEVKEEMPQPSLSI